MKLFSSKSKADQSGMLLLLSLVMTSVVLTAALILATLIIRESRVSQISDKGQLAFLATESAAEESVYQILQLGVDPLTLDGAAGSFSNGATWTRTVTNTANSFIFDFIPANQAVSVNLYNKDNANDRADLSSMSLSWSSGTNLEVEAYVWDGATLSGLDPLQSLTCSGSCSANVLLDPSKGYALVFTASGTAVTDLDIQLTPSTNIVQTPTKVVVRGNYRGAEQELEMVLPEPPPWEAGPIPPSTCNNGIVEAGEDCDPLFVQMITDFVLGAGPCLITSCDLNTDGSHDILDIQLAIIQTNPVCTTIEGYSGGQSCNASTCAFDACVSAESCGDTIQNGTETCEPPNTASCDATCQSIVPLACSIDSDCVSGACQISNFVMKFGSAGSGDGQFLAMDVTLDGSGNMYIVDQANNRVQKFDSSGNFLMKFGSAGAGNGQFYGIYGIEVDNVGNIYVANDNEIQKFDSAGNYLLNVAIEGLISSNPATLGLYSVQGIALDSSNNVYAADTLNYRIMKYDSSGNFLMKFGTQGTGDGQFDNPQDVAIDSSGNIYVADKYNYRIQKFDSSGNFLMKFGTQGSGEGQFNWPNGINVDSLGNIYVTDRNNPRIQKFDSSGNFIIKFGSAGGGDGQFQNPRGIEVDISGNIYVADTANNRIQKFSSTEVGICQ